MKLPHVDRAVVSRERILEYLLAEKHPKGKAGFFSRVGFSFDKPDLLAGALRSHALKHSVDRTQDSPFGIRYIVEGTMETPDGRDPMVRSIWFIEYDFVVPRLVTAYPIRRKRP
jgi:hypothetical protein